MSIGLWTMLGKSFFFKIFQEMTPSTTRITEVPKGVCGNAFPDPFVTICKERLEAPVQIADLGIQAQHGDDAAQVQIVAVVLQPESIAALYLGDELAPALDQSR